MQRLIFEADRQLMFNERVVNMSRIDWGKTMSISNQYIQQCILQDKLGSGFQVFSTDETSYAANNSPGYDLLVTNPERQKQWRVQSKLRQVNGKKSDVSHQIHFETTRRNSSKNTEQSHTGHVCYGPDEFDFVMLSLVNDARHERSQVITNCDLWTFCLIPVSALIDPNRPHCCVSHIKPEILQKYILNEEIAAKFT
jgi:hypothetical protein